MLLTSTDARAPIPAVVQLPLESSRCAGPCQRRAIAPSETARVNRSASARASSAGRSRRRAVAASPTASTGSAAFGNCQHEDRGGERCGGPESESERRQVAVAALAVLKAEAE